MADAVDNTGTEPVADQATQQVDGGAQANQPQYTEAEQRALAQGWVPKDQYTGAGKWRDAEEFNDRGELFAKIDEQNREIKATKNVLEALKTHHRKVAENEYKRALATLRDDKKNALLDNDVDKVLQIDDQIEATRVEQAQAMHQIDQMQTNQNTQNVPNPAFVAWVNRNSWYQNEKAMKVFADQTGAELAAGGMHNPTEILAEVERRTKKEFAHKFTNPARKAAGAVDGGGTRTGGARDDGFQLTAEETQVMNKLVRHKVMTRDEYIADIKAERGV